MKTIIYLIAACLINAAIFLAPLPASAAPAVSGKVVETLDSGGYTYVHLENAGRMVWVVVPQMKVAVGEEASFKPGDMMSSYTDGALNRTFENIIFSPGPAPKEGPPEFKGIKVEKAAGPDAFTVAEVHQKRKALQRKTVVVRGMVVRVTRGIMNRNWIHLQDGTGDPKKGTETLVVTSQADPKPGEVVTFKGIIRKDADFGSGHKFPVIMEKAGVEP